MAMQNVANGNEVFIERAKELLKSEEYERLQIAVKNFLKTRSVETLCSNLFKIDNLPSNVDILAEVKRCLPKNQRNKFTRYCNELLKTEALRERRDLEKKRKMESKERCAELENRVPNFQGSPAKKTKKDIEKPLSSKAEKKASKEGKKSVPDRDCAKEVSTYTSKSPARMFDAVRKLASNFSATKIIILERDSLNHGFGFRIRGGNSRERSITVAEVAKGSLADIQGLKKGDHVVRVNDKRCGKGGVNIAHLIRIIKAATVLHMRIASAELACGSGEAKRNKTSKLEEKRASTVVVYPGEDGWLGCCIRGGADYACDVHVISVDARSPAERAGVMAGDVIITINGTSTKGLTHVQIVRLAITSGPCVTFSLKPSGKQRRRSSRRQTADVRPTPLRTQHIRSHDVTPPRSTSFRQFHLPGYPHEHRRKVADSPSQLPLDAMSLDCLPPPPYTPEVPSRHRVLARGKGQETPPRQSQDTNYLEEPQGNQGSQQPQGTQGSQDPQESNFEQEPHAPTIREEPQGAHCSPNQLDIIFRDEAQGNLCQQESWGTPSRDVAMERIENGLSSNPVTSDEGSCKRNLADVLQSGSIMEEDSAPHSNIMQQENMLSLDAETPVACDDSALSSSINQSPARGNGRESFLSQIRQFNKANLKRRADCPQSKAPDELHSIPDETTHTPNQMQSTTEDCGLSSPANQSPPHDYGRESFLSQIQQFNKAKLKRIADCPQRKTPGETSHTPDQMQSTTEDCSLSSPANQSPTHDDGRESFLSQIRQFNKAKLRKSSVSPTSSTFDQLQSNSGKRCCTVPELQSTDDAEDDAQENIDAGSLFTALTRVMRSRARVLHDTLSSADECDTDSNSDGSDEEWEL